MTPVILEILDNRSAHKRSDALVSILNNVRVTSFTKGQEKTMSLYDERARAVLDKPLIARVSVIDDEGYPHTVPVWFMRDGDDIVFISARDTRKVDYLSANPRGAVVIGGESDDGGGYLIKGDFVIEPDPNDEWVRRLTYRYEEPAQAEQDIAAWADLDIIVLRLKPRKVIKVA